MKTAMDEDNVDFNSTGTISISTSLTDVDIMIDVNDGNYNLSTLCNTTSKFYFKFQ